MLPFFWYLLKVMICSGILFGYYWVFLRNKIFHGYNRFYLLSALFLSLLLPILKIGFWQPAQQQNQVIKALQAVSAGDEYMNNIVVTTRSSSWDIQDIYPVIYVLISTFFLIVLLRTLLLILSLLKKYPVQLIERVSFVNTEDNSTPFSFLKYIFWNSGIDMDTTTGRQIFKHEVAHIQEKHTYDKLFVNIILIFYWCNPFFWLYRKELNMIHEFIADQKAVEDNDTAEFASMILQAAYPKHRFELTNNFFYSPIKRRLLMLTKNNNPRVNYLARLMALPLLIVVFAAFAFKQKTADEKQFDFPANVITDTVPLKSNLLPADPAIVPLTPAAVAEEAIDPEKALIIYNGIIIGKEGKRLDGQYSQLIAKTLSEKRLKRPEAIEKYGEDGINGAIEYTTTDAVNITTAYVDADKMPVFYIGLNNSLAVNAQNINPEDLILNISDGTLAGNDGKYNVKVNQVGDVKLTFSKRDGTEVPGSFTIKVKRLPDPNDPEFPASLKNKVVYDTFSLTKMKRELDAQQQSLAKLDYEEMRLKDLDVQKIKLRLEAQQQNLAKLDYAEKEVQVKAADMNKETALAAKKLQELEIQKLKDEYLFKKKVDANQRYVEGQLLAQDKAAGYQKQLAEAEMQGKQENIAFTKVEVSPMFTGGDEAWKKYLMKNLNASIPVDEGWKPGKYTIILKFIVHTDGTVSDITTENYKGSKTAKHCIEVIKKTPNWQPAIQNGKKVNAYHKQPITFVISAM